MFVDSTRVRVIDTISVNSESKSTVKKGAIGYVNPFVMNNQSLLSDMSLEIKGSFMKNTMRSPIRLKSSYRYATPETIIDFGKHIIVCHPIEIYLTKLSADDKNRYEKKTVLSITPLTKIRDASANSIVISSDKINTDLMKDGVIKAINNATGNDTNNKAIPKLKRDIAYMMDVINSRMSAGISMNPKTTPVCVVVPDCISNIVNLLDNKSEYVAWAHSIINNGLIWMYLFANAKSGINPKTKLERLIMEANLDKGSITLKEIESFFNNDYGQIICDMRRLLLCTLKVDEFVNRSYIRALINTATSVKVQNGGIRSWGPLLWKTETNEVHKYLMESGVSANITKRLILETMYKDKELLLYASTL